MGHLDIELLKVMDKTNIGSIMLGLGRCRSVFTFHDNKDASSNNEKVEDRLHKVTPVPSKVTSVFGQESGWILAYPKTDLTKKKKGIWVIYNSQYLFRLLKLFGPIEAYG